MYDSIENEWNLEDWNKKWWNLEGGFSILAKLLIIFLINIKKMPLSILINYKVSH